MKNACGNYVSMSQWCYKYENKRKNIYQFNTINYTPHQPPQKNKPKNKHKTNKQPQQQQTNKKLWNVPFFLCLSLSVLINSSLWALAQKERDKIYRKELELIF